MLLLKVAANGSAAADKINTDGWQSTFSVIAVAKNIWQIPCCSC